MYMINKRSYRQINAKNVDKSRNISQIWSKLLRFTDFFSEINCVLCHNNIIGFRWGLNLCNGMQNNKGVFKHENFYADTLCCSYAS